MQNLDFAPRDPAKPNRIIARFSQRPVQNNWRSEKEGRPVYEDREFVELITPGNTKSIPVEEVTDDHKRQFHREYDAWKAGQERPVEGMPLSEWPQVSGSTVLNLNSMHIRTVEELAAVDDGVLQVLGTGARELREKAKAWLASARGEQPLQAAVAEIGHLQESNALLSGQLKDALDRLSALEAKRGPGRPRATPQDAGEGDDGQ